MNRVDCIFKKDIFKKYLNCNVPIDTIILFLCLEHFHTHRTAKMSIFGCATGHAVFKLQGEGKLDRKDKVNSGIKDTKMNKSLKFATNVFNQNFAIVKVKTIT